jgi:hypothetical protein
VTLFVAVGIVAGEVGEGLSGIGGTEAAAAVSEGAVGLSFLGFEGADAGGEMGELSVDVVILAYVRIEAPVLGRILDFQCEGVEDLGVAVDGTE